MAEKQKAGSGGKRKLGRNGRKPSQQRYNNESRWIRNKAKKIAKYLRRHPNWTPNNLDDLVKIELKKLLRKQEVGQGSNI